MDERNQNPHSDHHHQPGHAELVAPLEERPDASRPGEAGPVSEIEADAHVAPAASVPNIPKGAASSAQVLERYWKLILIAILLLAVALRTRGLDWDEGQHLHPDERFLTMVGSAIRLPASLGQYFDTAGSPLNPYNNNFGSFVYGTAPLFLVRLVGEVIGLTSYENMNLLGRALSALADVFVVALVFAVGRRLYGFRVGILAALLYTLSVLPIKQSHFFTVDTFTNVPLMLAFWFTLDIVEGRRRWRAFALAGLFFGLMLASRINLVPYLGIIALGGILYLVRALSSVQHLEIRRSPDLGPEAAAAGQASPVRAFRIGPLLIEVEFKPEARSDTSAGKGAPPLPNIWPDVRKVVFGLVILAIAAFITFRIAQPYAFEGTFSLNPQFVEDMKKAQRLVSGQDDYPPGHQWTNRTPYWFAWYNLVFWGLGPALGFTAWLGVALAVYQVLRYRRWEHLLMLFWVLGMFFYHGQQFVMTMRYLMPLYPFLAIFAAFFMFEIWDGAKGLREKASSPRVARSAPLLAGILFAVVLVTTFFWAVASTSIYARTNTRVAASRWIYDNVPGDAVLGNEHWDDTLPLRVDGKDYFRDHQGVMLELYGEDTPEKRELMVQWMDQVDYIILSSNRLYGSIPRLPMRYPLTTKYYEWLFSGQLGFERAQEFTSYPQFLGITIDDDQAEEAFTVYDHPKVIIFRKTSAYSHDNIVRLFNSVDLTEVLRLKPIDAAASRRQFRMDSVSLAANRAGGTWSDLFNPNDLANRLPVPVWLGMVWLVGLLAAPFTFVIFRGLADRGYAFAKALGILFVAWFAWTLSSYRLMPFGRLPILLGLLAMLIGGILVVRKHRAEMGAFVRKNLRLLLIEELIFFAFFGIDLWIRYQNPDLWHPALGGEKPMDFAFLNAILKSTYFPPYNPWFTGNYINYYYFGQLISAVLVRLSGIVPEISYNLLIPLFFALTAACTFGVVFNLVLAGQQQLSADGDEQAARRATGLLLPSLAGIFGIVLVLLIGNLGEVKLAWNGLTQLGGGPGLVSFIAGLRSWLFEGTEIPIRLGDWYWTATRAIPDTINEFPFFTFIYGDLHAHLIAIPFTIVALGLATHLFLNKAPLKWYDLLVLALALGALRAINTWDYPTYLGIAGAALALRLALRPKGQGPVEAFHWSEWLQQWLRFILVVFLQIMLVMIPLNILGIRVGVEMAIYVVLLLIGTVMGLSRSGRLWEPYSFLQRFGWQALAVIVLSVVLFLPYILNYATGYVSVETWKGVRTTLNEYLTVHGIFLFITGTFLVTVLLSNYLRRSETQGSGLELTGWAVYFAGALVIAGILLAVLNQPIPALVLPFVGAGIWIVLQRKTPVEALWITVLALAALVLTLLVEFVILKGDVGRMNTVFKFYLQAWVLFGVTGAAGLGLIVRYLTVASRRRAASVAAVPAESAAGSRAASRSRRLRWIWWGAFSLLVLAGLVYPLAAGQAKMKDRYIEGYPPGLNGMDYMQGALYYENNQELQLRWDNDAMQWIRANIKGSPVIMEANTGLYRWGNRYSIYTGLPTVIGWDWHTKQQYSLLPSDLIDYRISLVQEFYNTTDPDRAREIAKRYGVSYVIVGGLERAVYDPNGLSKFDQDSNLWSPVYQNEQVKIYQVR